MCFTTGTDAVDNDVAVLPVLLFFLLVYSRLSLDVIPNISSSKLSGVYAVRMEPLVELFVELIRC